MASDPARLRLWEKATLLGAFLTTIIAVLLGVIKFPLKTNSGGETLKLYLYRLTARTLFGSTNLRQQQTLMPFSSVLPIYEAFARQKGFVPNAVDLPGGAKGLWIGNPDAQDLILYFVGKAMPSGGGYVVPLTPGHLDFCWQAKQTLHQERIEIAILLVQYTLSPQTVYPEQLKQCVETVRYVVEDRLRPPSNLLLAGDSAGATLILSTLAHITHPHPSITPLIIKRPFRGLLLISPWGDFNTSSGSWKYNIDKDMCAAKTFESWSEAYLGGKKSDNYTEPCHAGADWWKGLQARKVMVTAGGEEVLVDSVIALAKNLKTSHPDTTLIVGSGECHVAPISSYNFGDAAKGPQARAIDSWLVSSF